jgi:hypothetical protein
MRGRGLTETTAGSGATDALGLAGSEARYPHSDPSPPSVHEVICIECGRDIECGGIGCDDPAVDHACAGCHEPPRDFAELEGPGV